MSKHVMQNTISKCYAAVLVLSALCGAIAQCFGVGRLRRAAQRVQPLFPWDSINLLSSFNIFAVEFCAAFRSPLSSFSFGF